MEPKQKMSQQEYLSKLLSQIDRYKLDMALELKLIAMLGDGDEIKQAKALIRQLRMVDFLSTQYKHFKYGTTEALTPLIKDLNDLKLAEYALSQEKSALKIISFKTDDEFLAYLIKRG